MDLIIVFITIDIIASKFLDCYISSYRPQHAEQKFSLLSKVSGMAGMDYNPWSSFFASVVVAGTAITLLENFYGVTSWHWLFVVLGLFTSVLNLGSAHSAYFMKTNFITRRLLPLRS